MSRAKCWVRRTGRRLPGKATSIWKKLTFKRYCWLIKSHDSCVENSGCIVVTDPGQGTPVVGNHTELRADSHIKELISRTRCRICREKGHWARECPNKGKQMLRDSEEVKTSFFVFFGGDHCTPSYIGKGVIDTGCSRFLIGQHTLEKWEQMLTQRWGLSTQRIQLEKAMTFRFGNELGLMEYCVCTWCLEAHRFCCQRNS